MKILDFNTYQNIYDDEAGWGKRTGYFVVLWSYVEWSGMEWIGLG